MHLYMKTNIMDTLLNIFLLLTVAFSNVGGKPLVKETKLFQVLARSREEPKNWKNDTRYEIKWTPAGFTYNTPKDSNCGQVILPEHGRLICTNGQDSPHIMCMSECMKGYEKTQEYDIFFCTKKGIWSNIYKEFIPQPKIGCVKT